MVKLDENGSSSSTTFGLILVSCLLVIVLIFGIWAFAGRQSYKNDAQVKINSAVKLAQNAQIITDAAQAAQAAKNPLTTYSGPQEYGSIVVNYPKTWSAYVDDTGTSGALVDGYFAPGYVPSISSQTSVFALRVQVLSQTYASTLQEFQSQEQSGQVTSSAYALPKVPSAVGVEVSGQLNQSSSTTSTTTMVVLPLRSNTLEIYTEGSQYLSDFNTYILPNFSFSP